MNIRTKCILTALTHVSDKYYDLPINVIEIGTMYNKNEGLSTYIIADFISKRVNRGKFISMDYDLTHINECKKIINKLNPSLNKYISYENSDSITSFNNIIQPTSQFHFVLIDGGAHPEICLSEFEFALNYLAKHGVIIVDDAQEISYSQFYQYPRQFGKATLILPILMIANYLNDRKQYIKEISSSNDPQIIPNSKFINELKKSTFSVFQDTQTAMITRGSHKLLLVSKSALLTKIKDAIDQYYRKEDNKLLKKFPFNIINKFSNLIISLIKKNLRFNQINT